MSRKPDHAPASPAPAPDAPAGHGERRDARKRRSDLIDRALSLAAIIAISIFFAVGIGEVHKLTRVATDVKIAAQNRTNDLRGSCRRASQRTAADVNLDWLYYLSEVELEHGHIDHQRLNLILGAFPPQEQVALLLLIGSGGDSRAILRARSTADFNAAYVNAQTIDYHDLKYVHRVTSLGSGSVPYNWVRAAHYDCTSSIR